MVPHKIIKIGNFTYKVLASPFSGSENAGETCVHTKEIVVYKDANKETVQDTIMHEALHAICEDLFEAILPPDSNHEKVEESFVRLATPRILRFLQENPKWTRYLSSSLKRS